MVQGCANSSLVVPEGMDQNGLIDLVLVNRRRPALWQSIVNAMDTYPHSEWKAKLMHACSSILVDDGDSTEAFVHADSGSFLVVRRGTMCKPTLTANVEADIAVDVYASQVVDNPDLYQLAGQHLLRRAEFDVASEINIFSVVMHPCIAKLLCFTTSHIGCESCNRNRADETSFITVSLTRCLRECFCVADAPARACHPRHLVFESTQCSLYDLVIGTSDASSMVCTDKERLFLIAQLVDVAVFLQLRRLRAADLHLKNVRIRASNWTKSRSAAISRQRHQLQCRGGIPQIVLTPLCNIRQVDVVRATEEREDAWRLSHLCLQVWRVLCVVYSCLANVIHSGLVLGRAQVASGTAPSTLGVSETELKVVSKSSQERLGPVADRLRARVACGVMHARALSIALSICCADSEPSSLLDVANSMRARSRARPEALLRNSAPTAGTKELDAQTLLDKIASLERRNLKLSKELITKSVGAPADDSTAVPPNDNHCSRAASDTDGGKGEKSSGDEPTALEKPPSNDPDLSAPPLNRVISVGTLVRKLSERTDECRQSSARVVHLEESSRRQSHMFAQLFRVWNGRHTGAPVVWTAVAAKETGSAIGAIYEKNHTRSINSAAPKKRWMGKYGLGETASVKELLACHAFSMLARGSFVVPKTRLAMLPLQNEFNKNHGTVEALIAAHGASKRFPHIMSKLVQVSVQLFNKMGQNPSLVAEFTFHRAYVVLVWQGYHDFADVLVVDPDGKHCSLKDCFAAHRAVPSHVYYKQQEREVPLHGLVQILACATLLADVDVIGPSFTNAGIVWNMSSTGEVVGATAVKVDPGCAFSFESIAFRDKKRLKGMFRCNGLCSARALARLILLIRCCSPDRRCSRHS